MSNKLLLVRHGETALNVPGDERIRGFQDVKLNDKGRQQAIQTALKLKDYPISVIYFSPLDRARETADYIKRVVGAPIIEDARCTPWRCGNKIEGKPVAEVLPLIKYYTSHPKEVPPGGGESFRSFSDRFLGFLREKLEELKNRQGDICVVAHSRDLQLVRGWQAGGRKGLSYDDKVVNDYTREKPTGSIMEIDANGIRE